MPDIQEVIENLAQGELKEGQREKLEAELKSTLLNGDENSLRRVYEPITRNTLAHLLIKAGYGHLLTTLKDNKNASGPFLCALFTEKNSQGQSALHLLAKDTVNDKENAKGLAEFLTILPMPTDDNEVTDSSGAKVVPYLFEPDDHNNTAMDYLADNIGVASKALLLTHKQTFCLDVSLFFRATQFIKAHGYPLDG